MFSALHETKNWYLTATVEPFKQELKLFRGCNYPVYLSNQAVELGPKCLICCVK